MPCVSYVLNDTHVSRTVTTCVSSCVSFLFQSQLEVLEWKEKCRKSNRYFEKTGKVMGYISPRTRRLRKRAYAVKYTLGFHLEDLAARMKPISVTMPLLCPCFLDQWHVAVERVRIRLRQRYTHWQSEVRSRWWSMRRSHHTKHPPTAEPHTSNVRR